MTDKTVIVTGPSQGIGAGLGNSFLERGYNVVATSRQASQSPELNASERLAGVDGDIADPETAKAVVEAALARFGSIDALAVIAKEVVLGEPADGGLAGEGGMRPEGVVVVQPGMHRLLPVCRAVERLGIGPFADTALDEALGFAISLGRVEGVMDLRPV